jgi:hypothetical protein
VNPTPKRPNTQRHSTALLAALGLTALSAPALACGNAMKLVAHGLFPDMFWGWFAAFAVTMFVYYFDDKRAEPLSKRSRLYVALALFALATAIFGIYYGATTNPNDWRLWDLERSSWVTHSEDIEVTF